MKFVKIFLYPMSLFSAGALLLSGVTSRRIAPFVLAVCFVGGLWMLDVILKDWESKK